MKKEVWEKLRAVWRPIFCWSREPEKGERKPGNELVN